MMPDSISARFELPVMAPGVQLEDLANGELVLAAMDFDDSGWAIGNEAPRAALEQLLEAAPHETLGKGPSIPLRAALSSVWGIDQIGGYVGARRVGDAHGSHFEWEGLENVAFTADLRGACAAFLCHLELPRVGAFWHALYQLNYEFLAGDRLWEILQRVYELAPDDERLDRLTPNDQGVVVRRTDDQVSITALAQSETDGLTRRAVILNLDGVVIGTTCERLIKPISTIFY
jgi:hypothetical protein